MTDDKSAINRIGILGGGAWGTALAVAAAAAGRDVVLWARNPAVVDAINDDHANPLYLPAIDLDPAIRATGRLAEAAGADALLLAVPAQHLRGLATDLAAVALADRPLVICCKGIEQGTGATMGEVLDTTMPGNPQAVLSGPTFAIEVARGLPTAVTLAAADPVVGQRLIDALGRPVFRPYYSADPRGAELGGAVKNVLAIACGIVEGRALGDNARAALISRGLAELLRLGRHLDVKSESLMGLAGLGDLVLTCTSGTSRNYSLGVELGRGRALDDILKERRSIAEGVWTADALHGLAKQRGIDMPIVHAVHSLLHEGAGLDQVIGGLLTRPFTSE